jgi:Coenzyme PQQ synthesis protein D (PqqD)
MYVSARAPAWAAERETSAGTGVAMVFSFRSRIPAEKQCADSRLTPAKHVVSTMHGTRTVLLDSRSGHYYGLDEVGTRIWQLAEAGFDPSSIAQKLAQEYDAPPERLEQDVHEFINELMHSRLLEEL